MENSIDVRRVIGYLPENNPLYTEMYVKEYLEFVAGIFKISNKSKRVEEMIEMTGLQIERRKKNYHAFQRLSSTRWTCTGAYP